MLTLPPPPPGPPAPSCAPQVLNDYLDRMAEGQRVESTRLRFFVAPEGEGAAPGASLDRVEVRLPGGRGGLRELFRAFGLDAGLEEGEAEGPHLGSGDTALVEFLQEQVGTAVELQREAARLKGLVSDAATEVVGEFGLAGLAVGEPGLKGATELAWSLAALEKLRGALRGLAPSESAGLHGHRLHLHRERSWGAGAGEGAGSSRALGEDGRIHLVADGSIAEQLLTLNVDEARVLSRLERYWRRRIEQLAPAATEVLGVKNVVSDHLISPAPGQDVSAGAQAFVLWAGKIISNREAFELALNGRTFDFSLLVHGDRAQEEPVFAQPSSHIVQVRDDCPPHLLLKYLVTGGGGAAQEAAEAVWGARAEETELLERVREAFGARHVIRVCPADATPEVMAAAKRLLRSAAQLQGWGVDLRDTCLAIDDCYEVWDSGFISIPYDFELGELCARLQAALPAPSPSGAGDARQQAGRGAPSPRGEGDSGDVGGDPALHSGVTLPEVPRPSQRSVGRSVVTEALAGAQHRHRALAPSRGRSRLLGARQAAARRVLPHPRR